ncbi:hypothetical protein TUMEXPCC7403_15115 [Tumidithrix helvetica PCC 7403]|uniref:VMAP-C domain-containing protein n=1 Tax=Tumidithrix helvetica TaxID=3457545 RepID=UPI003CA05EE7
MARKYWKLSLDGQKLLKELLKELTWESLSLNELVPTLKEAKGFVIDRETLTNIMDAHSQHRSIKSRLEGLMTALGAKDSTTKAFEKKYFEQIENDPVLLAMSEAYRKCCPEGFDRTVPQGDEMIRESLNDMKTKDGIEALSRFACLLHSDNRIPNEIKARWETHIKSGDREKLVQVSRQKSSTKCSECYRLMIYVADHHSINGNFSIQYALLKDFQADSIEQEMQPIPICSNLRDSYKDTEIVDVIRELLDESGAEVALSDLILEIFLPIKLMGLNLASLTQSIDGTYRLFIRFQKRQGKHLKRKMGDWKKSWDDLIAKIELNYKDVCILWNNCIVDFSSQFYKFQYVSCSFTGNLEEFPQIVDKISESPICTAVWAHQGRKTNEIEDFVFPLPVGNLPRSLAELRQNVWIEHGDEPDRLREHYAHYIYLLWDNPYRMFPATIFTSEST